MTTPLPPRTAANDRLIAATPYANLTDRQKQYAQINGVKLQPAPAATPEPVVPPGRGIGRIPFTGPHGAPNIEAQLPVTAPDPNAVDKFAAQRNALALIKTTLAQYGLPESLGDWAWSEIVAGKGSAEIMLDLRQRPEFKAEFPEIDARVKAKLAPLSPGDIVSYRQNARQLMSAAGLPQGFYDSKDDFTKLLVSDVSLAELNDRVQQAKDATFNIPEQAKRRLAEEFGVPPGSGLLTSFFLDPERALPLITRDVNAAKIGARADLAGYGNLSNDTARGLADQGVSESQAAQGFADLAVSDSLFNPIDAGETAIDQQAQLAAAFGGNADAQRRIEERRARRKAQFAGGGGFAETQKGLVGLGSAEQA